MSSDLRTEDILLQVREKLNQDQVKLWLPPYYVEESGSCDSELENLSKTFSSALNLDVNHCLTALCNLQARALERLHEREQYRETGVATLKVRVPSQLNRGNQLSIHIKLSVTGRDLQEAVGAELNDQPERMKLICNGRVLNSTTSLGSQGVKHGSQLMAIILHEDTREVQGYERNQQVMEATKAAAKLLADTSNELDDDYYTLQIADQSGKKLNLPREEKRALLIAMSLHEKGRVAMKTENYALALVLLLEADKEFSVCNSQILQSVDNFALLNLDITWCYLCLRSVTHLPDAEQRLKNCEQSFIRSYGPNLERVMALKGTTGNEAALFMRLHLLQAIVLFHQNKRQAASQLLSLAETELGNLKVDDGSICQLMELGYSPVEARISLRATRGDVNEAVELINRRRQEREELRKKEAAEHKLNRERRKLGKCADGNQWVEPQLHQLLLSMGFETQLACRALQHTNNNVQLSVQLMQEQPQLLQADRVAKEAIDRVVALGFNVRIARNMLKRFHGSVEQAIEELLRHGPGLDEQSLEGSDSEDEDHDNEESRAREEQRELEKEQAFNRLAEGMSGQEEDHLDFSLVHEECFLNEYKTLLNQPNPQC